MKPSLEKAIAIVGVGAILPDAPDVPTFWNNLLQRRYSISEAPAGRWSIQDYYDPDPLAPDKTYSKIGGWVQGYKFDWQKYRIPPKVAAAMDEGQQWAVSIAGQALADYGYPERVLDSERTGVILGTAMGGEMHYLTYLRTAFPEFARALQGVDAFSQLPAGVRQAILERAQAELDRGLPPITEDSMPGELPNIVSGRVANVFNLRGPNFITDAACASSFAAIQAAIHLLNSGQVEAVLTGGVDHNMGASTFIKFCKIGALSATGTRPFGDGADGFVMGEGAAMFLLKRLADAERDGDRIYAVIRGVGGASDGKGKGITAPNPLGQQYAMQRAWESAGLDPASATLVEAHGTSTKVGDVVEVESLSQVFCGAAPGSIALGSVKSNIGHLKAGAGAAGMLKAALSLHHNVLPPTLNAEPPNPAIDFVHTPFRLNHQAVEWPQPASTPRRCGVSAYGFGGTNFHLVLEEHVPGMLDAERRAWSVERGAKSGVESNAQRLATREEVDRYTGKQIDKEDASPSTTVKSLFEFPAPSLRGIFALGAADAQALGERLTQRLAGVQAGGIVAPEPNLAELFNPVRLVIDFAGRDELFDKLIKAQKALAMDAAPAWKALQAQGIFYGAVSPSGAVRPAGVQSRPGSPASTGNGQHAGKLAFLFPGQGSQYLNMGAELAQRSPVVAAVFAEADRVMTPILGRPLTDYLFVTSDDPKVRKQAELALTQTAITQPAMLTLDIALFRLLQSYGFEPDIVMGHSLGEYAALIAAGVLPFEDALEAAAARGREMSRVQVEDCGKMAAIMAPHTIVRQILTTIDGYVVEANINSPNQCVIGGASQAVEAAIQAFQSQGYQAMPLPVSHAFHTQIVAPASGPLRQVLNRLRINSPKIPLVANVTGDFYPSGVEAIKDLLQQQIASPVQWVKGLERLYQSGVRTFVEVGPKKALKGFVDDMFAGKPKVVSLFTNHPKTGEIPSFNQALCGLYAAGYLPANTHSEKPAAAGVHVVDLREGILPTPTSPADESGQGVTMPDFQASKLASLNNGGALNDGVIQATIQAAVQAALQTIQLTSQPAAAQPPVYDRNLPPTGSVVISGTGLGLPGAEKPVMDPDNALRILRGEQFVDLIPERFRKQMLSKHVMALVKSEDGSGQFHTITEPDEVIRLAGRCGPFDLEQEYGVPGKLIEALDITTQLAMAAGLDALREAGIPLVQTYRKMSNGKHMPDRWLLPEALRDETGVIFASAFPGGDRFADEFTRYYTHQGRVQQLEALEDLRGYTRDEQTLMELNWRIIDLRTLLEAEPYEMDRRFIFRVLALGHAQFAEYIGARGPNTHVNAACASTTQALALAEDWIRSGRCRRVIVLGADNVTGEHLMGWVGAGFLATGAAATDDRVDEAALPFDRRRHGTLLGMGACAMVVESEDTLRQRGMRGLVELLSSETSNSAFHGTRLDVDHIAQVMDHLLQAAERRFGINRMAIAAQTVFISHETFTPARGGSAAAEVVALRHTFGPAASDIVMANTKGFTGHPMGVGIEDVIAAKILEYGIVPPVPNFREIDPDLGLLNLSRGGRYPVLYAIHLAAGFGSQIAMTFTRRIPGGLDRVDDPLAYRRWLADCSGYDSAETEVVKRVLRVKAQGAPARPPASSGWQYGTGPTLRAAAAGEAGMLARMEVEAETGIQIDKHTSMQVDRDELATSGLASSARQLANKEETGRFVPPVEASPAVTQAGSRQQVGSRQQMQQAVTDILPEYKQSSIVKEQQYIAAARKGETLPVVMQAPGAAVDTEVQVINEVTSDGQQLATRRRVDTYTDTQVDTEETTRDKPTAGPDTMDAPAAIPDSQLVAPADPVQEKILVIVAEKTGYPVEMLELELDMEADLGIDTVKQAETFVAIREAFDIPRPTQAEGGLKLRDYPTLGHVIAFVKAKRPDLAVETPDQTPWEDVSELTLTAAIDQSQIAAPPGQPSAIPTGDPVQEKVLAIVAEKTGYPVEMLELELDMEADLGIDTVKQAETFVAIREAFDIPRPTQAEGGLKLRDYPTLGHVIAFVKAKKPELSVVISGEATSAQGQATREEVDKYTSTQVDREEQATREDAFGSESLVASRQSLVADLSAAERLPRRMPIPVWRPALELCKPTGVKLEAGQRVVIGGTGDAIEVLAKALEQRDVQALRLDVTQPAVELEAQVERWLDESPIHGLYWLPALEVEPDLEQLAPEDWSEANRIRVKNLYTVARRLYPVLNAEGRFLITAVRLGGLHGYEPHGATAPLGGAVVGFTKAYKREQPAVLVKAVDFAPQAALESIATLLMHETLADPGVVEVGYHAGERFSVSLEEQPFEIQGGEAAGLKLGPETVFLVSGAAGGITSAILTDLAAAAGGGVFYLLDLTPLPERDDANIQLLRQGKETLKAALIAAGKAQGERLTPAKIEQKMLAVERAEAALRVVEAVEGAGGQAYYFSLDLRDGQAVQQVMDALRQQHGRIDVLIHAAGVEVSRGLADKDPAQFSLVYDVKADGYYHILHTARGIPIGVAIAFSSVAGRFGNAGQTDYSAANDLLCKLTSSLRRWRPETRGLVFDWTAWAEIGMATRGSIPRIMEMAGISMLPPEVGIATLRRELTQSHTPGELVVAGELGALLQEWDVTGGVDLERANHWLAEYNPQLFMLGQVKSAPVHGGLQIETELNPQQQPFLHDHALDGTPLLPGVMGTEGFAELAVAFVPEYRLVGVQNETFHAPFKFHHMKPQTLYWSVNLYPDWDIESRPGDLLARCALRSHRPPAKKGLPDQDKLHFTAEVHLTRTPLMAPPLRVELPKTQWQLVPAESIYQIYFHGPAYQVLKGVVVGADFAIGELAQPLPPDTQHTPVEWRIAPRLIELCFQTVGVWQIHTCGALALPLALRSVRQYQKPPAGCSLYAIVQASQEGDPSGDDAVFNASVVDDQGTLYLELTGYRTVQLATGLSL